MTQYTNNKLIDNLFVDLLSPYKIVYFSINSFFEILTNIYGVFMNYFYIYNI